MAPLSFTLRARRRPAAPTATLALAVAVAVAVAVALSGCGASAGSGTGASARARSAGSSTARVARPATSVTTSTSTSTTPALPGTGRPVVTIGDKNYTEQFVLGQLYLQALKAQGFSVDITQNIGPPGVTRQALANGSLGMYPEYLNVFDQTIAGEHRSFHGRRAAYAAGRRWAVRHGLRLLAPTPFSDTNGIAVTDTYAATHHLRTVGDLTSVNARFVLGGAAQFSTVRAGLPALADMYGVIPDGFTQIAVGSQYGDLDTGTVQAAYVDTTDGELATRDYRVLGDPHHIFGFGNVVPVVSIKVLAEEGPAFAATIERVDRTLSLATMRALNNAADVPGVAPSWGAGQYLEPPGLLDPLRASAYCARPPPACGRARSRRCGRRYAVDPCVSERGQQRHRPQQQAEPPPAGEVNRGGDAEQVVEPDMVEVDGADLAGTDGGGAAAASGGADGRTPVGTTVATPWPRVTCSSSRSTRSWGRKWTSRAATRIEPPAVRRAPDRRVPARARARASAR